MKKIAFLLLALLVSTASAEVIKQNGGLQSTVNTPTTFTSTVTITGTGSKCFSVDDPTLVVDCGNNRVGIGTDSPATTLHVVSANSADNARFYATGTGVGGIILGNVTNAANGQVYSGDGGDMHFAVGPTAIIEPLILGVEGNISISKPLTMTASSMTMTYNATDGRLIDLAAITGTNGASIHFSNTGGNVYFGVDDSAGADLTGTAYATTIWSVASQPMIFGTNNTTRLTLGPAGGALFATTMTITGNPQAGTMPLQIAPTTGSNPAAIQMSNTTGNFYVGPDGSGNTVCGGSYASCVWSVANVPTVFGTNNAARMTIAAAGNVSVDAGQFVPYVRTKAQIDAITAVVGGVVICSDCTVPYDVCVGTGTGVSDFRATINSAISTSIPGTLVNKGCGTNN